MILTTGIQFFCNHDDFPKYSHGTHKQGVGATARSIYNSWRLHASFEEARGAGSLRTRGVGWFGWVLTFPLWMKRSSDRPAIVWKLDQAVDVPADTSVEQRVRQKH